MKSLNQICVFCASSTRTSESFKQTARQLGRELAENGIRLVYGAGARGLMGEIADSTLQHGGTVSGVIPEFMVELEWAHPGISETHVVKSMHERKAMMVEGSDAVVALPGGSGTLEELMEVITMKRLGLYFNPIIIVNVDGFYDHLLAQFKHMISEQMMQEKHKAMWTAVSAADDVLPAIRNNDGWDKNARHFATL